MHNEFRPDFKQYKFIDAIIKEMERNHINQFSFKLSFAGGYSLKFIKNNYFVFDSINILSCETCKELLKKLGINKDFKICEIYQTKYIKCLELKDIKNKLNNSHYIELIKIYFDSFQSYLFKYDNKEDLKKQYDFLLNNLSFEFESIILLEMKLNQIINNSFKELINKKYLHLWRF